MKEALNKNMDDPVAQFSAEIFTYLTGKQLITSTTIPIKRHTENLHTYGDFSFVNSSKSWHDHLQNVPESEETLMELLSKTNQDLLNQSAQWLFKISRVTEDKGKERICLYLDRPLCIKIGVKSALNNHLRVTQRLSQEIDCVNVDPMCIDKADITSLRLQHLAECIRNLCTVCLESPPCIFVSFKSSSKCKDGVLPVLCGPVINTKSGVKEVQIKADDYLRYVCWRLEYPTNLTTPVPITRNENMAQSGMIILPYLLL